MVSQAATPGCHPATSSRQWPGSAVSHTAPRRASAARSFDFPKTGSHAGQVRNEPLSPPLVQVGDDAVAYLLAWEQHEQDGSWWAWVTWIRERSGRPHRHVTTVRAARLRPVEVPSAYEGVPRRVLGLDGQIRPWSPPPRPPAR
jgi:hypothetical protein